MRNDIENIVDKKIYFAHCVIDYDTMEEMEQKITIYEFFTKKEGNIEIINPKDFKLESMEAYLNYVKVCDILVFTKCRLKKITAGVYQEISTAFDINIPVYELTNDKIIVKITSLPTEWLNREESKEFFRKEFWGRFIEDCGRADL